MSKSKWCLVAGLIGAVAVGVSAATSQTQPTGVARTVIYSTPLVGLEGLEGIVYVADAPPGVVAPRHTHPGYEFNYVLSGSILIEPDDEKPITLLAGQATMLSRGHSHEVRNASTTEPAKFLVFVVKDIGTPILVPAN